MFDSDSVCGRNAGKNVWLYKLRLIEKGGNQILVMFFDSQPLAAKFVIFLGGDNSFCKSNINCSLIKKWLYYTLYKLLFKIIIHISDLKYVFLIISSFSN